MRVDDVEELSFGETNNGESPSYIRFQTKAALRAAWNSAQPFRFDPFHFLPESSKSSIKNGSHVHRHGGKRRFVNM